MKIRLRLKTYFIEDISHLFDTLKSAAQSEIKAYFVHAALENSMTNDSVTNDVIPSLLSLDQL